MAGSYARPAQDAAALAAANLFARAALTGEARSALERLAMSREDWAKALACNDNLSPDGWEKLYTASKTSVRSKLAARNLGADQIAVIASGKVPPSVAKAVFAQNVPLTSRQFYALSENASSSVAKHAIDRMLWPAEGDGAPAVDSGTAGFAQKLAHKAGHSRLLALYAMHRGLFSADDIVSAIYAAADEDVRSRDAGLWLQRILSESPDVLDRVVSGRRTAWVDVRLAGLPVVREIDDASVLSGLPGSVEAGMGADAVRDVVSRRYVLLALVNNPVVPQSVASDVAESLELLLGLPAAGALDPEERAALHDVVYSANRRADRNDRRHVEAHYSKVSDPATVGWLVARSISAGLSPRARPFDLVELAANPNLSAWQASDIATDLSDPDTVRLIGRDRVADLLDALVVLTAGSDVAVPVAAAAKHLPGVPRLFPAAYGSPVSRHELDKDSRVQTLVETLSLPSSSHHHRYGDYSVDLALTMLFERGGLDQTRVDMLCQLALGFDPDASVADLVDTVMAV